LAPLQINPDAASAAQSPKALLETLTGASSYRNGTTLVSLVSLLMNTSLEYLPP
jgi:hypothetical protein